MQQSFHLFNWLEHLQHPVSNHKASHQADGGQDNCQTAQQAAA